MSSGFISEAEIAEQRRLRQEEWEKVRAADQPLENMIKGLDDDEVQFLDLVDRTKFEKERRKNLEEEKEMQDFKAAVSSLQEKTLKNKITQELQGPQNSAKISSQSSRNLQWKLISGVVVKKSEKNNIDSQCNDHQAENKTQLTDADGYNVNMAIKDQSEKGVSNDISLLAPANHLLTSSKTELANSLNKNMNCIGILPGLGFYANSSDSDCSSETDEEPDCKKIKYDILGRKIVHSKDRDRS
ncbi:PSME3-interacting protein isoform X2 [Belonocnema kinseyi]|uniref:PSME3-interacting protein isoform X2 n=1 Tax=Belonocnema kinseyi TaxID=2817044 RepID=UPI00143D6B30|nr:PSME3-interacting protein isoform X2 [Belonocnema kinseyi]